MVLLLMFVSAGPVSAAPRVVVSIPPLYSLVSALMQGAEEPALILEQDTAYSGNMDAFQKSQMIAADMVIWVGPGLETPIARTLEQLPILDSKLITLSNYVPLLTRDDHQGPPESRQLSRDLRFWTDPRLAIMAVRMITPRLVRLDPEHQELYLDNEIALIKKLKILEQDIAAMFVPFNSKPHDMVAGLDRYFAHRFMASTELASNVDGALYKVSTGRPTSCINIKSVKQNMTPAASYYFETMRQTAQAVYSCIKGSQAQTTVAKQEQAEKHNI